MIKAIILDLLAGSWTLISLLFALVVLPERAAEGARIFVWYQRNPLARCGVNARPAHFTD